MSAAADKIVAIRVIYPEPVVAVIRTEPSLSAFAALEERIADTEGAVSMMDDEPNAGGLTYRFQSRGLQFDLLLVNVRADEDAVNSLAGRHVNLVTVTVNNDGTLSLGALGLRFDLAVADLIPDPSTGTIGGRLYLASAEANPDNGSHTFRARGIQIKTTLANIVRLQTLQ